MKAKIWLVVEPVMIGGNSTDAIYLRGLRGSLREAVILAASHPRYVVGGPVEVEIPIKPTNPIGETTDEHRYTV